MGVVRKGAEKGRVVVDPAGTNPEDLDSSRANTAIRCNNIMVKYKGGFLDLRESGCVVAFN